MRTLQEVVVGPIHLNQDLLSSSRMCINLFQVLDILGTYFTVEKLQWADNYVYSGDNFED